MDGRDAHRWLGERQPVRRPRHGRASRGADPEGRAVDRLTRRRAQQDDDRRADGIKQRIHKSPARWQVAACQPWLLTELIESTPAIPENCFSSGVATAVAIVSGLAPGSDAWT